MKSGKNRFLRFNLYYKGHVTIFDWCRHAITVLPAQKIAFLFT